MNDMPFIAWSLGAIMIAGGLAASVPWLLRRTSYGTCPASPRRDVLAALSLAGSLVGLGVNGLLDIPAWQMHVVTLCGALMLVLAYIDRITSWVPDLLLLSFCVSAAHTGSTLHFGMSDPVVTTALGVGFFLMAQLIFFIFGLLDLVMLPPPDIVGLMAPFVIMGLNYYSVSAMMLFAFTLLGCRLSPGFRSLFISDAARQSAQELHASVVTDASAGSSAEAASFASSTKPVIVTFLMVAFPILYAVMVARVFII